MADFALLMHVSFDPVDGFTLRVPENRLPGEDDKVPRICLSDFVHSALTSMPYGGIALRGMLDFRKAAAVLHLYTAAYAGGGGFIEPELVQSQFGVWDAIAMHEWWSVDRVPEFTHCIAVVKDATLREYRDINGNIQALVDAVQYDMVAALPENAPELYFKKRGLNVSVRSIFKYFDDYKREKCG